MLNQTKTQQVAFGAISKPETFPASGFPSNLGLTQLEHAVYQYRQAVHNLKQAPKHLGVL